MYKYLLCGTCKIATACHQPYPLPQATSRPLQCCSFFFPIQNSCFPLIPLNQGQHLYSTLHLHSPSCLDFLPLSGEPGIPDLSRCSCTCSDAMQPGSREPGSCWGWQSKSQPGTAPGVLEGRQQLESKTGSNPGGYKASCRLADSYKSAPRNGRGGRDFCACKLCSRGFGELLLSPGVRMVSVTTPIFCSKRNMKRN